VIKRYLVLIGFAVGAVILLMLDDPATHQARLRDFSATLEAQQQNILFPQLDDLLQITGIDVLDVTTGTGILMMRDDQNLWYAPEIPDIQPGIPVEHVNQYLVEGAAASFLRMTAEGTFEATPDNLARFGLQPQPQYRVRVRVRTTPDQTYEAALDIGNANPDNMAYYVYAKDDQRIFLISAQTVDLLLNMLTEPVEFVPTPTASPLDSEVTTPVP
jgi:hypothetical protein